MRLHRHRWKLAAAHTDPQNPRLVWQCRRCGRLRMRHYQPMTREQLAKLVEEVTSFEEARS